MTEFDSSEEDEIRRYSAEKASDGLESVSAAELLNAGKGDAKIQAAQSGMVVPLSDGLGIEAAIDPANNTQPYLQALEEINVNGSSAGIVLIPPRSVEDISTDITSQQSLQNIRTVGIGPPGSVPEIRFTDTTDAPFIFSSNNDMRWATFENIQFDGASSSNRQGATNGDATSCMIWRAASANTRLDNVSFRGFADQTIWFDTGHAYAGDWGLLDFGYGQQPGRNLHINDGDKGINIGCIKGGPSDASVMVDVGADANIHIGRIDSGGSPSRILESYTNGQGQVRVDQINAWGNTNMNDAAKIVQNTHIGFLNAMGGDIGHGVITADDFLSSKELYVGQVVVGKGGSMTGDNIHIPSGSDITGEFITEMDSTKVNNATGGALSHGISCLGDLTQVS